MFKMEPQIIPTPTHLLLIVIAIILLDHLSDSKGISIPKISISMGRGGMGGGRGGGSGGYSSRGSSGSGMRYNNGNVRSSPSTGSSYNNGNIKGQSSNYNNGNIRGDVQSYNNGNIRSTGSSYNNGKTSMSSKSSSQSTHGQGHKSSQNSQSGTKSNGHIPSSQHATPAIVNSITNLPAKQAASMVAGSVAFPIVLHHQLTDVNRLCSNVCGYNKEYAERRGCKC